MSWTGQDSRDDPSKTPAQTSGHAHTLWGKEDKLNTGLVLEFKPSSKEL